MPPLCHCGSMLEVKYYCNCDGLSKFDENHGKCPAFEDGDGLYCESCQVESRHLHALVKIEGTIERVEAALTKVVQTAQALIGNAEQFVGGHEQLIRYCEKIAIVKDIEIRYSFLKSLEDLKQVYEEVIRI